jgi:hypothetical protein
MTHNAVVSTEVSDTRRAAGELCEKIAQALPGGPPDALILFAAPSYDHETMLRRIMDELKPGALIGASSAGEFTHAGRGQGQACALALRSNQMQFSVGLGRGVSRDRAQVARQIASTFRGLSESELPYRGALVFSDALAGHADDLVDELTLATGGNYRFAGGGAGDNAQFQRTTVFAGGTVATDAAVALEILSARPVGIGVGHGWVPASPPLRVTEVRGSTVVSLNGFPAAQAFEKHAAATRQSLDRAAPIPFFLHNILGIDTGAGYRLRVPLAIGEDGSVACAAELPVGALVRIMRSDERSTADAAARATRSALAALDGARAQVALFFDCVATRLRLGEAFGHELEAVTRQLGSTPFLGCNTHGQIARAEGQFGGFHNCTAVVCALPE